MQNEIELKMMLEPHNIEAIKKWLVTQPILKKQTDELINTYYDTPSLFFANQKMGLRVRKVNQHCEMTLKTKGEIVGGLHIRPEYNMNLPNDKPDFKRLDDHFNLQFSDVEDIHHSLEKVFSTDVTRTCWLIQYQNAEIEIALDQGWVKNKWGEDPICEIELELKNGELGDLMQFLNYLPILDGMYFSALSKAERGYFVGRPEKIAKKVNDLTACDSSTMTKAEKYQFEQNLADIIRILPTENAILLEQFITLSNIGILNWQQLKDYLKSQGYLKQNIRLIQQLYL
ncbi:inorganic triphosphatase [Pasteurella atlantica]|uniref:CYTH domain-containing protein n=1 Tax=Pasteurellaceae TaxID=712 RepID=UPI002744F858|nr:CYTH domain-containing protein [Pasteurella atlantica]MDP8099288.1 CYTH domain-containing protein [Pasteurella atlantica]MDP8107247.1 CYTH domain-containing protein [Pasteurella atlantica]MDP8116938.1 CYTH domain-containing protein [Pasteurella atlantica]